MNAEDIAAFGCTGAAATWCPIHGDCTCTLEELSSGEYREDCPLHGRRSDHGDRHEALAALGTDE